MFTGSFEEAAEALFAETTPFMGDQRMVLAGPIHRNTHPRILTQLENQDAERRNDPCPCNCSGRIANWILLDLENRVHPLYQIHWGEHGELSTLNATQISLITGYTQRLQQRISEANREFSHIHGTQPPLGAQTAEELTRDLGLLPVSAGDNSTPTSCDAWERRLNIDHEMGGSH